MSKLLDKVGCFIFSYFVFIIPGQVWMTKNGSTRFRVLAVGKSHVICSKMFSGNAKHVFSKKEFRRCLFVTV